MNSPGSYCNVFFLSYVSHTMFMYVDMCIKLEGRRVDGTQPCKYDADCQPGCPSGQKGCCIRGRCWCYSPPVSANNIPAGTSQDAICFAN